MAFINPNTISNISREEFEELKERVNKIDSELSNITKFKSSENLNHIIDEETISSSNKLSDSNSIYQVREDINISDAKLNGIPRIEYFNFTKKEKLDGVISVIEENSDSNVINLSDILSNEKENKLFTYRIENIPTIVKTSSGHRTTLMSENKISNLKDSYYGDVKKIAA